MQPRSSRAERLQVYCSAALSLVGLVLMLYGTVEFYNKYLQLLGLPSDRDIWEGGDIVKAIEQRALIAGIFISGFNHAVAIMAIGAVLQCALVFRLTKNVPAALRALFQVELIYQALTSHTSKVSEAEYRESREAAATVVKMGNYGVYFAWTLNGLNITAMSVFERPLRATIDGRDLVSVWTSIGMALAVLTGVLAAEHLATAVWSVWYMKPKPPQNQLSQISRSSPPTGPELPTGTQEAVSHKDTDLSLVVSTRERMKAVLGYLTCTISVLAHLSTMSIIALAVGGLISAVAAGHFFVTSLAYYAVTRRPIDSIFWGYITGAMHLAFNRRTHRNAWWFALVWTIIFSSIGIVCGSLQASMYLFTREFNTDTSALSAMRQAANDNGSGFLPVERYHGVFTACMAAADLMVYLIVVFSNLHRDADNFEAAVQMPAMPVA